MDELDETDLYTNLHKKIYFAVVNGDIDTLKHHILLIQEKKDSPFRKDPDYHNTPLHYAAKYGRNEVIRVLIEHGHPIDCVENDGWTPLHWASNNNKTIAVQTLISFGANPLARTRSGKTPRDMSTNPDIRKILLDAEFLQFNRDNPSMFTFYYY